MLSFWQGIPEHIDPVAFVAGPFAIRWYGIFYAIGLSVGFLFLLWRARRPASLLAPDDAWSMAFFVMIGTLIGAHLGYMFLYYDDGFSVVHLLRSLWPINSVTGTWTGVSGMSFHGGAIGAVAGLAVYARLYRHQSFWSTADELALATPIGLFFGRIGNFLNGELVGRVTASGFGMHFPGSGPADELRFPSQIAEAVGEGVILFVILHWYFRRRPFPGSVALLFLMGYGCVRFLAEFWREPDPQIGFLFGGYLTLGQVLSLIMVILGLFGWRILRRYDTLESKKA